METNFKNFESAIEKATQIDWVNLYTNMSNQSQAIILSHYFCVNHHLLPNIIIENGDKDFTYQSSNIKIKLDNGKAFNSRMFSVKLEDETITLVGLSHNNNSVLAPLSKSTYKENPEKCELAVKLLTQEIENTLALINNLNDIAQTEVMTETQMKKFFDDFSTNTYTLLLMTVFLEEPKVEQMINYVLANHPDIFTVLDNKKGSFFKHFLEELTRINRETMNQLSDPRDKASAEQSSMMVLANIMDVAPVLEWIDKYRFQYQLNKKLEAKPEVMKRKI